MLHTVTLTHNMSVKHFLKSLAAADLSKVKLHIKPIAKLQRHMYRDLHVLYDGSVYNYYWRTASNTISTRVSPVVLEIIRAYNRVVQPIPTIFSTPGAQSEYSAYICIAEHPGHSSYLPLYQLMLPYSAIAAVEYGYIDWCNRDNCKCLLRGKCPDGQDYHCAKLVSLWHS